MWQPTQMTPILRNLTAPPIYEAQCLSWQKHLPGSFVDRRIQKASNVDIHVIARRER
jgi:hypothetical protein